MPNAPVSSALRSEAVTVTTVAVIAVEDAVVQAVAADVAEETVIK